MLQVVRQEQYQKLALTRSLQLSIHVLQMGRQSLEQYVEQELLENPFLDLSASSNQRDSLNGSSVSQSEFHPDSCSAKVSLEEHLIYQLDEINFTLEQRALAEKLVYCLDENGFLSEDINELASLTNSSFEEIRRVTKLLQMLEPTGVFATNILGCLALQLSKKNLLNVEYALLLKHIALIADGQHEEVCVLCNVREVELEEMLAVISKLNFHPCLEFELPGTLLFKIPDIIMVCDAEQNLHAELNSDSLPKLLLDDGLFSLVKMNEQSASLEDSRYYQDCYNRAAWLVIALQKRANTMLAIGNELAQLQRKFILSGQMRDRVPLQMQVIASQLGFNKSTISRALAERSIKTDYGVFDAKVFFVRKANSQLENTTIDALLQEVRRIIRSESRNIVYSDQQLCNLLADVNLRVSRRSISNYRKMLNIPSSSSRRKMLHDKYSDRKNVNFYF